MNKDKDRRNNPIDWLKIEKRDDGSEKIVGYAAKFNRDSEPIGGMYIEQIAPGAFKKALKKSDTRALFNHNRDKVLGRVSAGTLKLEEDKTGLWIEIDPPDTSYARDLMSLIRRGDITQQSFGFTVAADAWEGLEEKEGQVPKRTLKEIDMLYDVSPVTFAAYPDTGVALRHLDEARAAISPGNEPDAVTGGAITPGEKLDKGGAAISPDLRNEEINDKEFWGKLKESKEL